MIKRAIPYDIKPSSSLPEYVLKDNLENRMTSTQLSTAVDKYLIKDEEGKRTETVNDLFYRVASTISKPSLNYGMPQKEVEEQTKEFYDALSNCDFMPNSPTLMNAGRELGQLSGCFVVPIDDSIEDIFESAKIGALIHKSGGGTGYSFARLRPKNAQVQSTRGVASGPTSFISAFNVYTEVVKQGSTRRGANMGILDVNHPDIPLFIHIKQDPEELTNFNLSVAITDKFMEDVKNDKYYFPINPKDNQYWPEKNIPTKEEYEKILAGIDRMPKSKNEKLKEKRRAYHIYKEGEDIICTFNGHKIGKIIDGFLAYNAQAIFNEIIECSWNNGEPGVIFIDRMNKDNPTPKIGRIESTNPCGEQPLLPYESCNLGSINLSNFVKGKEIDWNRLEKIVRLGVNFMDNVVDINKYPLAPSKKEFEKSKESLERVLTKSNISEEIKKQIIKEELEKFSVGPIEKMTKGNRKLGLGVMGWADMLIKLNIKYDSEKGIETAKKVMKYIQETAKSESRLLAKKRGSFPNIEQSIYAGEEMRNATVTTIAPTGTISMIAGCSGGIEPIFDLYFTHTDATGEIREIVTKPLEDKLKEYTISSEEVIKSLKEGNNIQNQPLPQPLKDIFRTSSDIPAEWHLRMQAAFQEYTDNAVSKTVNAPITMTKEDVKDLVNNAYDLGLKGLTVYRDGSREAQILNKQGKQIGTVERKPGKIRVGILTEEPLGKTIEDGKIKEKTLYGTLTFDEYGQPLETFWDTNFAMDPDLIALMRKDAIDGSMAIREGDGNKKIAKLISNSEKVSPGNTYVADEHTGHINTNIVDAMRNIYAVSAVTEDERDLIFGMLGDIQKVINKALRDKSKNGEETNGKKLTKKEKEKLYVNNKVCSECGEKFRRIGGCLTCNCGSECG